MSDHEQRDSGQERPRTALEELMREIEEAETHVDGPDCEDHQHRGEAADALRTNRRAQEESEGH